MLEKICWNNLLNSPSKLIITNNNNIILRLFGDYKVYLIYNLISHPVQEALLGVHIAEKFGEGWCGEAVENECVYKKIYSFPYFCLGLVSNFQLEDNVLNKYRFLSLFAYKYSELCHNTGNPQWGKEILPVVEYLRK